MRSLSLAVRVRRFAISPKSILKLKEDSCLDAVGTAGQLQKLEIASLA